MNQEYLTMDEIEKRYTNEWVLIDMPKATKTTMKSGYVVVHSPDRDEFDRITMKQEGLSKHITCLYTGKPDPDEVWMF